MGEKLLIIGPSWVGDMVMLHSLIKTLKQNSRNLIIDVVAPRWSAPVVGRMPEASEVLVLDTRHGKFDFFKRVEFARKLKARAYTKAIVIPRSFKSALVPFLAKIPLRTGFLGEMRYFLLNDIRELDKNVLSQTVTKMLALGLNPSSKLPRTVPYPVLSIKPDKQKELKEKFNIKESKRILGIMPGAEYGPAKQWPLEYFAKVAQKALEKNTRF